MFNFECCFEVLVFFVDRSCFFFEGGDCGFVFFCFFVVLIILLKLCCIVDCVGDSRIENKRKVRICKWIMVFFLVNFFFL